MLRSAQAVLLVFLVGSAVAQTPPRLDVRISYVPKTVLAGEYWTPYPIVKVTDVSQGNRAGILVRVAIASGGGYFNPNDTATTDETGEAVFGQLILYGHPGTRQIVFFSGSARDSATIEVQLGPPSDILITRQPSPQIISDSVFHVQPVARVVDNAANPIEGVEVQAGLCYTTELKRLQSACGFAALAAPATGVGLLGTTVKKSDASGDATFTDLAVSGPQGYYQLVFKFITRISTSATSAPMFYDADRSSDRNYLVISAIRSIAGRVPSNEFFDVRFRSRYSSRFFTITTFDIALTSRGTDTVRSSQVSLTEAMASGNVQLNPRLKEPTQERERATFFGGQLRVFNTLPYYGVHFGGIEHTGSPFTGSTASVAILHRMSDTLNVVDGDTVTSAPWNLFADFFIRSSTIDFFKKLNLRGGVMLPLKAGKKLQSRVTIAVPVETLQVF